MEPQPVDPSVSVKNDVFEFYLTETLIHRILVSRACILPRVQELIQSNVYQLKLSGNPLLLTMLINYFEHWEKTTSKKEIKSSLLIPKSDLNSLNLNTAKLYPLNDEWNELFGQNVTFCCLHAFYDLCELSDQFLLPDFTNDWKQLCASAHAACVQEGSKNHTGIDIVLKPCQNEQHIQSYNSRVAPLLLSELTHKLNDW